MNIHLKEQLLKIADDTEGRSLIDGFSSGDSIGKILEKLYQTIDSNLSDSGYSEDFSDAVCSKLLGILIDNLSAGVEFDAALTSALSSLDFLFVSDSFNDVSVSERFITALASGEKLEAALDAVVDAVVPESIRSVLSPEARAELIQAISESLASSTVSEGNTQTGIEFSSSFLDVARKAVTETLHRSRDSMETSSSDSAGTSKSGHKNDNHEAGPQNANTSNETLMALASGENVTQVLQALIGNNSSASTDQSSLFNHVFVDSLQNGNTLDSALRTMAETGRAAHSAALNTQGVFESNTSDDLSVDEIISDEQAGENSSPSDEGNSTQIETNNARANAQASSEGNNNGDTRGSGNAANGSNGRNGSNNNPANQTDNSLNSDTAGSQELMLALASGDNVEAHISQFAENSGFAASEGFFQDALVSALASSTSITSAVEQATSFVESETTQTAELELRDNPDYEDGTDLLAALASGDGLSEALDDLPNPDNQNSGPQGASTNLAQLTLMNELASGESVATAMAQATVVAQELNQAAHNTQTIQASSLGTHEATESGSESLVSNNDGDNDQDQVQGLQADQAADTQSLIEALASGHNVSVQLSEITQGQGTVAGNAIQQTLVNVLSNGADVNLALTQANNLSLEISQIESELQNNLFSGQNNSSDENTRSNDPQNSDELSRQEVNSSELSTSEEQSVESANDHQAASDLMIALSSGENIETVLAEISGNSELENSREYFQALGQALASGVTGSQSIANAGASQQQSVEAIAAAQLSGSNLDEGNYQTQANSIEQDDLSESFNTQQTSTDDLSEDIVTGTDAEVRENTIIKIASLEPSGSSSTFSNVRANEIQTGNTANDYPSSESFIGTGNYVNEHGSAQIEETDSNETNLEPEDTEKEREEDRAEERAAETEEFVLENIQPIARVITLSAFEDDASISDYLGVSDANIFDSHQFTLTSTPANGNLNTSVDGAFTYELGDNFQSLAEGQSQEITFQYHVEDNSGWGNSTSEEQSVTITILGRNDSPSITGDSSGSVTEDIANITTGLLIGFDIDNNTILSWRVDNSVGEYGDLVIDNNGQWSYQLRSTAENVQSLTASDFVHDSFQVSLSDEFGASAVQVISVDVSGINDTPIISGSNSGSVAEDRVVSLTDTLVGFDIDNNAQLDWRIENPIGTYGDLSIDSNGQWTYQLNNNAINVQALSQSDRVTDTFTVELRDQFGEITPQSVSTVSIDIEGTDDVPIINGDLSAYVTEDALSAGSSLLTVSGEISAVNGDAGEAVFLSQTLIGSYGDLAITENGTWIYSADNNQENIQNIAVNETLLERFTVTNADGVTRSSIEIGIRGVNDAPTINASIQEFRQQNDAPFLLSEQDLLAGANDVDNNTLDSTSLTVSDLTLIGGEPAGIIIGNGTSLNVNPSFYTYLAESETENIHFTYTINDGQGGSVAQTATISITGTNDAPTVSSELSYNLSEDNDSFTISIEELLSNANDIDGDALNVENVLLISGDDSGITLDSNRLLVNPGAYGSLALGDANAVIEYSYDINDGNGGIVSQTARITITPENDAPVITSEITETFSEDAESYTVNLLDGVTDIDGDELNIAGLTLISGDASGFTSENNSLTINPNAYNYLAVDDQDVVVHYIYYIDDGIGGLVSQTATFTITSVNDAPTVFSQLIVAFTEDEPVYSLDLLAGAIDPDGELLTVSGLSLLSGNDDGISFSQNSLTVDPNFYTTMAVGDSDNIIVYNYDIIDGSGGIYSQTASIIISSENDNPSIASAIYSNASEDDAVYSVNLLSNATDIDGDTLNISDLTLLSGDTSGVSFSLNALSIDPSVYGSLAVGDPDSVIEYSYTIVDGNGGAVSQTATITISPENDNPIVASALTFIFSEDDSTTSIDLLNGAIDPDGDALEINAFTVTTGNSAGLSLTSNSLTINPGAYTGLALNDPDLAIEFTYGIVDNNGGIINQTGSITITPENDIPIVSSTITYSTSINSAIYQVDLLAGASDVDAATTLNVEGFNVLSGNNVGVTLSGNSLIIDPVAYIQLTLTEDETIQYAYTITDGDGGSVNQTADINISGVSDIPRSAFSIASNPNLGDDSLPSYEVNGLIDNNNSQDLYRFDLLAGERVILDIDYARHVSGIDTVLTLYDFNGDRIAYWDDSSISSGGGGSEHSYDSYVNYQAVGNQDTYYIGVTSFSNFPTSISEAITNGGSSGSYQLNISIDSSGLVAVNEKVSAPFDSISLIREDIVSRTDVENNLSLSALLDHENSSISVREFEVPERFIANDLAQEYQENTMFNDFNEWNAVS